MGPGPNTVFELSPTGDLTIAGQLTFGSCPACDGLGTADDRVAQLEARVAALEALLAATT